MCVSAFRGGRLEKTGGGYAASQYGSTGQSERPTSAALPPRPRTARNRTSTSTPQATPVNKIDPTGLLSWDDIKEGGKNFLRGGKPAPAWVALCYTSNSLTGGGSEDGTVKTELSDLRDCADPTSDFQDD